MRIGQLEAGRGKFLTMRASSTPLLFMALILAAAACGEDEVEADPGKAMDWGDVQLAYGAMVSVLYDGGKFGEADDTLGASVLIAEQSAEAVLARFPSCASAAVNGSQVSYEFRSCDALFFGMDILNGKVTVNYSATTFYPGGGYFHDRLSLDMHSDGYLQVGDASLMVSGSAGNEQGRRYWRTWSMQMENCESDCGPPPWTGFSSWLAIDAIGPRGIHWVTSAAHIYGDYEIELGCVEAGAGLPYPADLTADGVATEVSGGFERCKLACPTGTVILDGVSYEFDGSATPNTSAGAVQLDCVPHVAM